VAGFAVAAVLISAPGPIHVLHLAGGLLTLVTGIWIAHVIRRTTPTSARTPAAHESRPVPGGPAK
jgi:hypothetical protein